MKPNIFDIICPTALRSKSKVSNEITFIGSCIQNYLSFENLLKFLIDFQKLKYILFNKKEFLLFGNLPTYKNYLNKFK